MIIITLSKTFRRKMENLPEDLVEYIISFTYDRRGYNSIEYCKRKKENEKRMERIRIEILHWTGVAGSELANRISVSWLKPTQSQRMQSNKFKESLRKGIPQIFYHTGCYLSETNEERATDELEMDDY
jgi:hypothetical protein